MTAELGVGPFINEEGDIWVPASVSFRVARAEARSVAMAERLAYLGKETVPLTPHEYGCECDPSCYRDTLAYHFEERDS